MIATKFARRYGGNLVSVSPRSLTLNNVAALTSCSVSLIPLCHYSLASAAEPEAEHREVFWAFKDWFRSGRIDFLDQVFKVLKEIDEDKESGLSRLGLRVSENFVLQVLSYGSLRYDVLSCLKFFDWAGHQPGFYHTGATFHAIFKILSRAKLMPLMLEILDSYVKHWYIKQGAHVFQNTIVMGYALAGQIHVSLQMFGRMRFQGLNLDTYTYNILLNALIEEGLFEAVEAISEQILVWKMENEVTYSLLVRRFCKQKKFDEAEAYLRKITRGKDKGRGLSFFVDALCQNNEFEKAGKLLDEFQVSGVVPMSQSYGVWVKNLVRIGEVNEALRFLEAKKLNESFIPDTYLYNLMLYSLLKVNRVKDACLLFLEMQDNGISPNQTTLSAAICFLCKAGLVDIALELNDSKSEFGMSLNSLAYSYLISAFTAEGKTNEACLMLEISSKQGHVPGRDTFLSLANALCAEKKLEKMKDLLLLACRNKRVISSFAYSKFISELCKAGRTEDAYLLFLELHRMNMVVGANVYAKLIKGLNMSSRVDIAACLVLEMQEKGYTPRRPLFNSVLQCLLKTGKSEAQFLKLLEVQLYHHGHNCKIYNYFIAGAGYCQKPFLAIRVFEMMRNSGLEPNLSSDILLLQSLIKNNRLSEAMEFFEDVRSRRVIGRRLCNTIIFGLCTISRSDLALNFMDMMKQMGISRSGVCYETLLFELCRIQSFDKVLALIYDLVISGRRLTSYAGNILLGSSMSNEKLYDIWAWFIDRHSEIPPLMFDLCDVIRLFSPRCRLTEDIERVETMIRKCFPLNGRTYNMILKKVTLDDMELACNIFNRLILHGFQPTKWTFNIIVRGYLNQGKTYKALQWLEEMEARGFDTSQTSFVVHNNQYYASYASASS